MGEIQPCPGESDAGETRNRGWDKELRAESEHGAAQKWEEARAGAEQARWGQIGQASQRPLGPHPSPQAVESRGSGLRDSPAPCSPRAQEFHQPREGGLLRPQSKLAPTGPGTAALPRSPTPTQATGLAPGPLPSPSLAGTVCARRWQKTNPPGWVCRERGNLDTVAAVANGRHTLRLFWGDCCRC